MSVSTKNLVLTALIGVAFCGSPAYTAQFASGDVRAIGMGGTGVASAGPASAALFNPALLSAPAGNRHLQFGLGLGAAANDRERLIDRADTIQQHVDAADATIANAQRRQQTLEDSVDRFINNPTQQTLNAILNSAEAMIAYADTLAQSVNTVHTDLNKLSAKRVHFDVAATLSGGVAGDLLGVGAYYNATAYGGAGIDLSLEDSDYLGGIEQTLRGVTTAAHKLLDLNCVLDDICRNNARDVLLQNSIGDYPGTSTGTGMGALLREYGLAFSHQFTLADRPLSVGITAKKVSVKISGLSDSVRNFDSSSIDNDVNSSTGSHSDYDVGFIYRVSDRWQAGLVGKYLSGRTYAQDIPVEGSVIEQRFELAPQWRAGVVYLRDHYMLALDADLTENSGVDEVGSSQYISLGGEYDLDWLQLRAGYRSNLSDGNMDDVYTAGIGLGPLNLAAVRSNSEMGYYFLLTLGW